MHHLIFFFGEIFDLMNGAENIPSVNILCKYTGNKAGEFELKLVVFV